METCTSLNALLHSTVRCEVKDTSCKLSDMTTLSGGIIKTQILKVCFFYTEPTSLHIINC